MTLGNKARDEIIKVYKDKMKYVALLNTTSATLTGTTITDSQFKNWSTNGYINSVPINIDETNEEFRSKNNALDNNSFVFTIAGRRNGKQWGYNTLILAEKVSGGHKVHAEIRLGNNTVMEDDVRLIPSIRISVGGK